MARSGVGTIIGRKSASKGREYTRIWIYVPTKVQEDTAFPFEIGDPCLVEIGGDGASLSVKTISPEEAAAECVHEPILDTQLSQGDAEPVQSPYFLMRRAKLYSQEKRGLNLENEVEQLYREKNLQEFEKKLGVSFNDKSLLVKALSHKPPYGSSLRTKEENRRLGMLGDKLIDLVLFESLYKSGSTSKEMDDLRKIKSSRPALNRAMREIGIEPYWILNPSTEKSAIEGGAKLGEDTFEALVGAIYLNRGVSEAESFVKRHLL